jgi:TetR/AcrR family transcriptional regulator
VQILQALATMLEQPGAERITTSALAARLDVSEAALYRHFASKAQMFEGLIEFIEQSVFTLINQIGEREPDHSRPAPAHRRHADPVRRKEPGHDPRDGRRRPGVRERAPAAAHEPVLRQGGILAQAKPARRSAASGAATPTVDAQVRASVLTAFIVGRLQRFARSGFKRRRRSTSKPAWQVFRRSA